jgi:hypothetical protein
VAVGKEYIAFIGITPEFQVVAAREIPDDLFPLVEELQECIDHVFAKSHLNDPDQHCFLF